MTFIRFKGTIHCSAILPCNNEISGDEVLEMSKIAYEAVRKDIQEKISNCTQGGDPEYLDNFDDFAVNCVKIDEVNSFVEEIGNILEANFDSLTLFKVTFSISKEDSNTYVYTAYINETYETMWEYFNNEDLED